MCTRGVRMPVSVGEGVFVANVYSYEFNLNFQITFAFIQCLNPFCEYFAYEVHSVWLPSLPPLQPQCLQILCFSLVKHFHATYITMCVLEMEGKSVWWEVKRIRRSLLKMKRYCKHFSIQLHFIWH